jgi:Na+/H+ antiporter NhaD/arsenite permease-like protein
VITIRDLWTVAHIVWDASFALIAIVVISVLLDGAGLFRWASLKMAKVAGGSLTPIGSLATLIWLHALQMKGMRITWQYYLKVGLVITPPVLLITLIALWASMALLG